MKTKQPLSHDLLSKHTNCVTPQILIGY